MSPKDVAAKWSAATAIERTWAVGKATAGVAGALLLGWAFLSGLVSLPAVVSGQDLRIHELETTQMEHGRLIAEIIRREDYLICAELARAGVSGYNVQVCAATFITSSTR